MERENHHFSMLFKLTVTRGMIPAIFTETPANIPKNLSNNNIIFSNKVWRLSNDQPTRVTLTGHQEHSWFYYSWLAVVVSQLILHQNCGWVRRLSVSEWTQLCQHIHWFRLTALPFGNSRSCHYNINIVLNGTLSDRPQQYTGIVLFKMYLCVHNVYIIN